MSKNFVDNSNATALMGAVEQSIANTRIFKGTLDEWDALTAAEQAKYKFIATPDGAVVNGWKKLGEVTGPNTSLALPDVFMELNVFVRLPVTSTDHPFFNSIIPKMVFDNADADNTTIIIGGYTYNTSNYGYSAINYLRQSKTFTLGAAIWGATSLRDNSKMWVYYR